MSAKPITQLQNVDKYYGDYHALRGIDLEINEGEFFSLLGPSGCGKTTLLRAIAGFEDVSSGVLLLSGEDMDGVPANKRPTNMVFQSYAIFPHLSVAENVGFGLRRSSMSKAEKAAAVEDALAMVGLQGYGPRAAHAMSGGQRQRVALARALILKPKVCCWMNHCLRWIKNYENKCRQAAKITTPSRDYVCSGDPWSRRSIDHVGPDCGDV